MGVGKYILINISNSKFLFCTGSVISCGWSAQGKVVWVGGCVFPVLNGWHPSKGGGTGPTTHISSINIDLWDHLSGGGVKDGCTGIQSHPKPTHQNIDHVLNQKKKNFFYSPRLLAWRVSGNYSYTTQIYPSKFDRQYEDDLYVVSFVLVLFLFFIFLFWVACWESWKVEGHPEHNEKNRLIQRHQVWTRKIESKYKKTRTTIIKEQDKDMCMCVYNVHAKLSCICKDIIDRTPLPPFFSLNRFSNRTSHTLGQDSSKCDPWISDWSRMAIDRIINS